MSSPSSEFPFTLTGTNRRYRWNESRKRFEFADGTVVPASAATSLFDQVTSGDPARPRFVPPQVPATGHHQVPQQPQGRVVQQAPPQIPATSYHQVPQQSQPRVLQPVQPQTVIYNPLQGSSQATQEAKRVEWSTWRQPQPFGRGSTIVIPAGNDEPPITSKGHLGSGMHATVTKVQVDDTREICALKSYKPIFSPQQMRQKFEDEILNMRKVQNRHIANFFAAYMYERRDASSEFGILMQPAADGGNLETKIADCRRWPKKVTKESKLTLMQSFGCLASAVEFIHQHMIRHKDVKPGNILLHKGKVLLADFGSSWDGWGQKTLVTNNDNPKGHTPRYAAPEVNTKDPRNAKSDVFSLGCVFYEILCGLEPRAKLFNDDYWRIAKDLRNSLGQWSSSFPDVVPRIYQMLDPSPDGRPWALQVRAALPAKHFCEECCQQYQKFAATASASKQPENPVPSLAGLSIYDSSKGVVPGPSAPPARRGSTPAVARTQRTTPSYAPGRARKQPKKDDSSEDDGDDSDDTA